MILAVNVAVAAVYVFAHAIIAISNREQRAALWFSAAYFVGMLSPLTDFLVPFVGMASVLEWVSYFGLLGAMLLVSAGIGIYHRVGAPWLSIVAILIVGVIILTVAQLRRGPVSYDFAYQLPFVLASLLAACCAFQVPNRRLLHVTLTGLYIVLAVSFLMKPLVANAVGSGASVADYSSSTYALLSQASTGILLLVSGIVLLLLVAQNAIATSLAQSEVDPMSGLYNRRGFEWRAEQALARAGRSRSTVSLVVFDLDHFKALNDTHGHAAGDTFITEFSALLKQVGPAKAVFGRTGGEEFAMLMEGASIEAAWRAAEAIRAATEKSEQRWSAATSVSGGVAELIPGESLTGLMCRADAAAYQAKREGRNRICRPA